jgi:hypothetical protein
MGGDLYPLPVPPVAPPPRRSALGHASVYKRVSDHRDRACRARHSVQVLNACASGQACGVERPAADRLRPSRQGSTAQSSVLQRIHCRIAAFGRRPIQSPEDAVNELLRTSSVDEPRRSTLATFAWDKLKLLRADWSVVPQCISKVAPPAVAQVFEDPSSVRLSAEEVQHLYEAGGLVEPYWDSRLRGDLRLRLRFLLALKARGLVSFRRQISSRVGIFFVEKKNGAIRMVIDARQTNQLHKMPPHVALGSARAWAMLDFSGDPAEGAELWSAALLPDAEDSTGMFSAGGDLCDGFYQFVSQQLGEDFGLDYPDQASYYECSEVFHGGQWESVRPDEIVYPCFVGLAAGWSWAMWAMHSTVSHVVASSTDGGEDPLIIEDKRITPLVQPGFPLASTYVDNFAILGCQQSDTTRRFSRIVSSFSKVGVALHELSQAGPSDTFEQLGLHFAGDTLRLRAKPSRAWRLYLGIRGLVQRQFVFGWQVRIILGHIINYFQLCPLALAVLGYSYRFVHSHLEEKTKLWKTVAREMWLVQGLIFLADLNLAAPWCPLAFCGDACEEGYALHVRELAASHLKAACSVRERWRFLPVEKLPSFDSRSPSRAWNAKPGIGASLARSLFPAIGSAATRAAVHPEQPCAREVEQCDSLGSRSCLVTPLPDEILERRHWSLVVKGAWSFPATMHCKEGRVALLSLQRCARNARLHGSRVLTIGDNLAEICASEKGRSDDPALRRLLQRALAYTIGPELQWYRRYAESARNPSDYDSRWALRCMALSGERRSGPASKEGGLLSEKLPPRRARPGLLLLAGRSPAQRSVGKFGPRGSEAGSGRFSKDGHLRCHRFSSRAVASSDRLAPWKGKCGPRAAAAPVSPGVENIRLPPGLALWRRGKDGSLRSSAALFGRPQPLGRCGARLQLPGDTTICSPPAGMCYRLAKDGSRCSRRLPPSRAPAQSLRGTGGRPRYFLELFAGNGYLTAACYAAGLRSASPFDIKASRLYDLTRPACQRIVLRWIKLGQIWCVHLGTPCSGFSVAQRGENNASSLLSRVCAAFSLRVIKTCIKHSVHWCIENPASSRLWSQPGFCSLARRELVHSVVFHMCRFGAPWLKPTRILSSFSLARLSLQCAGCERHMVLQGIVHLRNGKRSWLTAVAGCYPPALCRSWAKGIAEVCPDSGFHHGAPLQFEKWDSQLRQCPGCSKFSGCDQPRLPRCFSLPFDLNCKRCWTNF